MDVARDEAASPPYTRAWDARFGALQLLRIT
jgi:hypothetical protein